MWEVDFQNAFCTKFIIFRKLERKQQENCTPHRK